jgi:FMN reductase [NAD(P)H]
MENEEKYMEKFQHLELMKKRRSHRSFLNKPVEDELLRSLLEVGISAASGGNLQMYSIVVVRDRSRCEELCQICGAQPFIRNAAVNLIYVMDMRKMETYTRLKKAPFTANRSLMHFLVALEDIICSAQSIETAAWLSGLGSCYVGSPLASGAEMVKALKLPRLTFPVVMLSIGYPKNEEAPRPAKLSYKSMVFEETYKEMEENEINAYFEQKYADMKTVLPVNPEYRKTMIANFTRALETTYSKDEAAAIAAECDKRDFIWENQRRFGLQYHAFDLYLQGAEIYESMKAQGRDPFNGIK